MAEQIDNYDSIVQVIKLYTDGASQGDTVKLRKAFHANAHVFGQAGEQRVDLAIEPYFELASQHPLDTDGSYRSRLISVEQIGIAAVAVVVEDGCWGSVSFVNFISLSRIDGVWMIVNKSFAHTGGSMPNSA
jgi:Putative lumazine-binding